MPNYVLLRFEGHLIHQTEPFYFLPLLSCHPSPSCAAALCVYFHDSWCCAAASFMQTPVYIIVMIYMLCIIHPFSAGGKHSLCIRRRLRADAEKEERLPHQKRKQNNLSVVPQKHLLWMWMGWGDNEQIRLLYLQHVLTIHPREDRLPEWKASSFQVYFLTSVPEWARLAFLSGSKYSPDL